jgi:hypothetical protein
MLYLLVREGEPVDPFGKPLAFIVKASSEQEAADYAMDNIKELNAYDDTADKNGVFFKIYPMAEEDEEEGVVAAIRIPNPLWEYTEKLINKHAKGER